jgi:hypothetical protein
VSEKSGPSRVAGELADLTGRTESEMKLLVGAALAVAALGVALKVVEGLVELGATLSRRAVGQR